MFCLDLVFCFVQTKTLCRYVLCISWLHSCILCVISISLLFSNCCFWCSDTCCGLSLTFILLSPCFAVDVVFVAVLVAVPVEACPPPPPYDVLGKVALGVCVQGVCSSGVNSLKHRWCSMFLHMAGSQPGELIILFLPSSFPHSLFSPSLVSVNVCHFLCFFLSSAPSGPVSVGPPCCLSLSVCCVSLPLCQCVCLLSGCCSPVLQNIAL